MDDAPKMGTCPVCDKLKPVKPDGKLRQHASRLRYNVPCKGSGRKPVKEGV